MVMVFTITACKSFLIKFKGIRATGGSIKVCQTSTYIDEQPMINFELEFTNI